MTTCDIFLRPSSFQIFSGTYQHIQQGMGLYLVQLTFSSIAIYYIERNAACLDLANFIFRGEGMNNFLLMIIL